MEVYCWNMQAFFNNFVFICPVDMEMILREGNYSILQG